jgi:AcrR family transcriptional regulator
MITPERAADSRRRGRLSRDLVLRTAVELADRDGIESVSMRKLAEQLGVVPMALYKHVANKAELLDGMVDIIVSEIDPLSFAGHWQAAVRQRILSARRVLLRHTWARQVIESRTNRTPVVLDYMNSVIGMFRVGGFSVDLTHHVMHAIGSYMWGFTQELFDDGTSVDPATQAEMMRVVAERYPYIAEIALVATHDQTSVFGAGCDGQYEFEFALDLLLDGFARLHAQNWMSPSQRGTSPRPDQAVN